MKYSLILLPIAVIASGLSGCKKQQQSADMPASSKQQDTVTTRSTTNDLAVMANSGDKQSVYHGHGTGGILDRPTPGELQQFHAELVKPKPFHPKAIDGSTEAKNTDRKFSWRSLHQVALPTTDNDQSKAGFCYVFSVTAAMESSYMISHGGEAMAASEQHTANCVDGDGVRGGKASHAARYLVSSGTTSSVKEPYLTSESAQPSPSFKVSCHPIEPGWPTFKADATDFVAVDAGLPPASQMKQAILDHGPIACFIHAGGKFGDFFDVPNPAGTVITDDSSEGNHFVLVTGWDDDKSYDGGSGAWEIRNSWGLKFGDQGFAWVKYGIRDITDNAMWVHMP